MAQDYCVTWNNCSLLKSKFGFKSIDNGNEMLWLLLYFSIEKKTIKAEDKERGRERKRNEKHAELKT